MATTSKISVTEGTGKSMASYAITEDLITKDIQRVTPSNSAGVEILPLLDSAAHAEDVPAVDGDRGVYALGVRNDAQTTTTSTDGDYSQLSTDGKGNQRIVGNVDSGVTDAGSPVKIGGLAKTTQPTAVTDAQRVAQLFDKLGKSVSVQSLRELKGKQSTTITSSTAETTIVTAGGAGVFLDVYALTITNTSTTGTEVIIRDVTAGGTAESIYVPAGDTRGWMVSESAASTQATANSAWTATCTTSVASVKITAKYVKNI